MTHPKPNFRKLKDRIYLVRTQAGLMQAINEVWGMDTEDLEVYGFPTEYPSAKSKFNLDDHSSNASIMEASIGQEKTTVSPLHMALISSAIANNGILMETQVIDHTTNAKEVGVKSYDPEEYGRLFSNAQASIRNL